MDRRGFLGGLVGALGLVAGCLQSGRSSEPTPTPTPREPGTVDKSSVRTFRERCIDPDQLLEDQRPTIDVSVESEGVTVLGSIRAPSPCYNATVQTAEVDHDSGTLDVVIGVTEEWTDCGDCPGKLDYRARIEIDGPLPERVEVRHDPSREEFGVV